MKTYFKSVLNIPFRFFDSNSITDLKDVIETRNTDEDIVELVFIKGSLEYTNIQQYIEKDSTLCSESLRKDDSRIFICNENDEEAILALRSMSQRFDSNVWIFQQHGDAAIKELSLTNPDTFRNVHVFGYFSLLNKDYVTYEM